MNITIDISDEQIKQLKYITEEEDDTRAIRVAIGYTLDNY